MFFVTRSKNTIGGFLIIIDYKWLVKDTRLMVRLLLWSLSHSICDDDRFIVSILTWNFFNPVKGSWCTFIHSFVSRFRSRLYFIHENCWYWWDGKDDNVLFPYSRFNLWSLKRTPDDGHPDLKEWLRSWDRVRNYSPLYSLIVGNIKPGLKWNRTSIINFLRNYVLTLVRD